MSMIYLFAMKSKDTSTKIGAIVVGQDNEVVTMGFNGLPRGVNDNVPERNERPEKYLWYEHGERNALYNANRIGVNTKGCRMYTQGIPCADCARGIIQSGITTVITHKMWDETDGVGREQWRESAKRSKTMFKEVGVVHRWYVGQIIGEIIGWRGGRRLDLNA
jgi:dCMP deaminase